MFGIGAIVIQQIQPLQQHAPLHAKWDVFRSKLARIISQQRNTWQDETSKSVFTWTAGVLAVNAAEVNEENVQAFEEEALACFDQLRKEILVDFEKETVSDALMVDGILWEKTKFIEYTSLLGSEISPETRQPFDVKPYILATSILNLIQELNLNPQAAFDGEQMGLFPREVHQIIPRQNQLVPVAQRAQQAVIKKSILAINHQQNPDLAKVKLQIYDNLIQGAYMRRDLLKARNEVQLANQYVKLLMTELQNMAAHAHEEGLQMAHELQIEMQRGLEEAHQLRQLNENLFRNEIKDQALQIRQLQQQNAHLQERYDDQVNKFVDLLSRYEQKARETYNLTHQPHKKHKKKFFRLF